MGLQQFERLLEEELEADERLRISCSTLAKVMIDGRVALIENRASRLQGNSIYAPLGGAVAVPLEYAHSMDEITDGAVEWEREPKLGERDARFTIPRACVGRIINWVAGIDDEHRSPARELYEELVEEEAVIAEQDFGNPDLRRLGYATELLARHKQGKKVVSLVIADVWTARFMSEGEAGILQAAQGRHPKIRLVSESRIPKLVNQGLVGGNALYFSRPVPDIEYPTELVPDNR